MDHVAKSRWNPVCQKNDIEIFDIDKSDIEIIDIENTVKETSDIRNSDIENSDIEISDMFVDFLQSAFHQISEKLIEA